MRLILMGPPGSGKGTQAALLCDRFHLEHISTGDILRHALRNGTEAGRFAKPYVERGELVPDDLVNRIVADRFRSANDLTHFLMDGYPRTVEQAIAFDAVLQERDLPLSAVILLTVDDEEIIQRLRKRGRVDDQEETVRNRLAVYHETCDPLISYYAGQGILKTVPGQGDIRDVFHSILQKLNGLA